MIGVLQGHCFVYAEPTQMLRMEEDSAQSSGMGPYDVCAGAAKQLENDADQLLLICGGMVAP